MSLFSKAGKGLCVPPADTAPTAGSWPSQQRLVVGPSLSERWKIPQILFCPKNRFSALYDRT